MTIKLLSWNVAGRTVLLPRQIEAVARRAADLVCLQEARASTAAQWRHALATEGLAHCTNSSEFSSGRRLFNLTASRWSPLSAIGGNRSRRQPPQTRRGKPQTLTSEQGS